MNITRLDHVVILAPDIAEATATYSTLLGRDMDWQHVNSADGTATTLFVMDNTSVELLAPHGSGPVGNRIRELLDGKQGLLSSLAFQVPDIDDAHYTAMRRGMGPGPVSKMQADYLGHSRTWSRFRCDDAAMGGMKVFMTQEHQDVLHSRTSDDSAVFRLDHLVVNTGNPERAMAAYGAKLGLRLALDRTNEDWGSRFLFFRLPDLTFEVVQRLKGGPAADEADSLWGLTWQVADLDLAHERLSRSGVEMSEVRKGRKPGTRVMSIKSHDLGVPTLFLESEHP